MQYMLCFQGGWLVFFASHGEVVVYDCELGPDGVWRPVRRRVVPCSEALAADYEGAAALKKLGEEICRRRSRAANVTIECRRRD